MTGTPWRGTAAATVLLLHAALLALFELRAPGRSAADEQAHRLWDGSRSTAAPRLRMTVRLMAMDKPVLPEPAMTHLLPGTASSPVQAHDKPRRRAPSSALPSQRDAAIGGAQEPTTAAFEEVPAGRATAALPAASAASAAESPPSWLDPASLRRAARDTHGNPSVAQHAVEAGASMRAATATARLSAEVERSGKGDCTKGEYAGSGLGLLSLPFLAAAALNGDCAK